MLDIGLAIADNRVVTDLASSLIAFQVGSTYEARSACDYDCVWTFTVVSRTSRFITITDRNGEVRRVGVRVWQGVESASPLGTYSMAPVISASHQVVTLEQIRDIIKEIDRNLEAVMRSADYEAGQHPMPSWVLHPSVIDSCYENAASLGREVGSKSFYAEALDQLLGELDAFGYNPDGSHSVSV